MAEILLTGLDGKNPLGFMAALGVVQVLAEHRKDGEPEARLAWRSRVTYLPSVLDGPEGETLVEILLKDLKSFGNEPATKLRYPKESKKGTSEAWDLKPPRDVFRAYLQELVSRAEYRRRRSVDIAAAFATDVAVDRADRKTKPTALHFTAGNQEFLKTFNEVAEQVGEEDLREALFGPWVRTRETKQFGWDNSGTRDYALRADDPSSTNAKKRSVPGADWLAFRGLSMLRVAPIGDRIATTGCHGEWKTGAFRWPIWTAPVPRSVILSLLASPELFELDPVAQRERGIAVVLEAGIRRSEQGGYGSFGPARVARRVDGGL